ncbi:hypothetical protein Misp01_72680 [Microtetraspora sp. NBRC 13810]|nr:hypothetical protein Misp01_72680 [Microtetraspora sp. NBRC 13810]
MAAATTRAVASRSADNPANARSSPPPAAATVTGTTTGSVTKRITAGPVVVWAVTAGRVVVAGVTVEPAAVVRGAAGVVEGRPNAITTASAGVASRPKRELSAEPAAGFGARERDGGRGIGASPSVVRTRLGGQRTADSGQRTAGWGTGAGTVERGTADAGDGTVGGGSECGWQVLLGLGVTDRGGGVGA